MMKVLERNVMRLAVVQHIRATYNIKTKNWNKNKANSKLSTSQSVKVFGVALESLPHCPLLDYGSVPSFLVDACTYLLEHANTEGLFRKSGSILRLKALRAKLDQGEECLSSALPVDVAALLKQFFRELPEPVLSMELHAALLKAQELSTEEERTSATMLLSCVLPERNLNTLRYFFSFLQSVSQRSAENKMDSSNLSVIFAPNLLHFAEGAEKMNAGTERKLKLQAAVVHCFIQNARNFGVVPQFLQEKVPAMLGCGASLFSPPLDHAEEHAASSGLRRSHRRSLGDLVNGALNKLLVNRTPTNTPKSEGAVFSSATPVIMTPNTKRKLPLDSGHNHESSNKKRRSIKKNLGIELLPHVLFGAGSTPGSVHSASGVSPSVVSTGRTSRLTASSARRKSKRLSYRTHQINRHESGKTGCFSPRVPKKEAARKSLRMRFSLGKGIKDTTLGSQALGAAKGSETIGWRLATQDSTTSFHFSKEPDSSPAVVLRNKHACKATKYISKSEDNLLSPQQGPEDLHTSWSGETPDGAPPYLHDSFADTPMNVCLKNNYFSEPAIVTAAKPPTVCSLPKTLCCATSVESLDSACSIAEESAPTRPTLLKIKRAFGESGSDLHAVVKEHSTPCGWEEAGRQERSHVSEADASVPNDGDETPKSECCSGVRSPAHKCVLGKQNITFGQIEIVPLSPLHIDSALFEYSGWDGKEQCRGSLDTSTRAVCGSCDTLDPDETPDTVNCSQLVDALDIQSPVVFRLNSVGCQSTPHQAQSEVFKKPSLPQGQTSGGTKPRQDTVEPESEPSLTAQQVKDAQTIKVQDQIQKFNMLTLKSPQAKRVRSPLKFQRTPVRHSVRRINSLLENSRKPGAQSDLLTKPGPMLKTTSLDAGLSVATPLQPIPADPFQPDALVTKVPSFSKTRPPVPPKRVSIRNPSRISALGDVTNKVPQRVKDDIPLANKSESSELPQKSAAQQLAKRETTHYRGSPRNPLNGGRLLSATKPIDL
ncbi:rho GTPase-activating protein 11A isoform X3 [Alosa alosa]|uniref:rho GTPase-activating protein 11A isoform X3 n=1 Tax=Alosa alosa TaxID=278164 RepID=UPI0020150EC2|nr:rho GTPase-activating protein 11A isoform X3 [Alosa alosa]